MKGKIIGEDYVSRLRDQVYTTARLVHRSFRIPPHTWGEASWTYTVAPPESDNPFFPHICWMGEQYSRVVMTEFRVGVNRLDIGDGIALDPFHCSRWPIGGAVDVSDHRFVTINPGVLFEVTLNFPERAPQCEHWFMMTGIELLP